MKKITIGCATPLCMEDFEKTPLYKSFIQLRKIYDLSEINFNFITNNTKGLPEVYNMLLRNPMYEKDILVFVHDDVLIEDLFFREKLNNSPYIITGLAGCNSINLNKPSAWHLLCNSPGNMLGEVAHSKEDKTWTTVFGPTAGRALLIDGLFIAIDMEKFLPYNVNFDEDFKFHHYDISFCLRCNSSKITVGVQPIKVNHYGLGDSMYSDEWGKSADIFKRKYQNNI